MTVGPLWSHEITLEPRDQSVGETRRFVRDRLDRHDLPMLVADVTLVASELATNALRHAGTRFTVTLTASAENVVVSVRDGSADLPVVVAAQADDDSGRGMAIVQLVSRDWGVDVDQDAGKSVWAAFEVG